MDCLRSLSTLLASFALAGLVLSGCSSGTEEPAASSPEEASAAAPGDEASAMAEPAPEPAARPAPRVSESIPENFPSDVPIYPGANASQGSGSVREGMSVAGVQLSSGDGVRKTFDYYERQLESEGWQIDNAEQMGNKSIIAASKGDRKVQLMIAEGDHGGSEIFVISQE